MINGFGLNGTPAAAEWVNAWGLPRMVLSRPRGFMRAYLAEHGQCDFNPMHLDSFAEYQRQIVDDLRERVGRRVAVAAPRGAAKSTIHSLLFPLMDLLSGRERHQVIISGTMAQSRNRIASIARELRGNGVLREAFLAGREGELRCTGRAIELGGCRIEAFSAGSEMRGVSHGEYRPTRIILDDVEQSRYATQAHHRARLRAWYDEVVENLGDSYTHITMVGTILHTDSLLSELVVRPGFRGKVYRSITAWDERPDLWREWQRLFTDRADAEAPARAQVFFDMNRSAMLAGTEVLWPAKEPYEKLQEKLLVLGRSAFFKEKMNSPIKDGDQIFDSSLWTRFAWVDGCVQLVPRSESRGAEEAVAVAGAGDGAEQSARVVSGGTGPGGGIRKEDVRYYGFLDPALGKSSSRDGDYAAIVTVGRGPDNVLYVADVWMEKVSPMKQVEKILALHQRFRYQKFGYEGNGFQETLGTLLKEHRERNGATAPGGWPLGIHKVSNARSKHSRISLLEPHVISGAIVFHEDLKHDFFVQADEYNGRPGAHDDGLDALASCVEMIRSAQKNVNGNAIKRVSNRVVPRGLF